MAQRLIWSIEVRHEGLNKYRHIRGSNRNILEQQANAQRLAWDDMWDKKQAMDNKKKVREAAIRSKEEKKQLALTKTHEAQQAIEQLEIILKHAINVDNSIDWNTLLDKKAFAKKEPIYPIPDSISDEPYKKDKKYQPKFSLLDKVFTKSQIRKEEEANKRFIEAHEEWEKAKNLIEKQNNQRELEYNDSIKKWQNEKLLYIKKQEEENSKVIERKKSYLNKDLDSISDYCEIVLTKSEYPDYFPQEWELEYNAESKVIVLDYSLPNIESLPTTKDVKYITSRDEFTESIISRTVLCQLYDDVLYQVSLRTVYELFKSDVVNALDSIVFNGWVDSIDKATGNNANACILSIQASKGEFLAVNLDKVDAKACFKQFKGVGSSKLHGLSPVAPIISINKEDRRFISAYDIADNINEYDNLAAMDWQDFENLIREVFEKEFAKSGGEVKITQASRDGGVDAVAFDPDPIRGGKIVIQAKRYTNVVGVSAVRDLYGTTLNEGATKGILVTTADYGPDAYEFAKGKPLTLLNGSNLLHLLEKHGHKAKIDLKEAKKILAEQKL